MLKKIDENHEVSVNALRIIVQLIKTIFLFNLLNEDACIGI